MHQIELKAGDIFCTQNPYWIGRLVNAVQSFHDVDRESKYSHAGIITNEIGSTFESLSTIRRRHLFYYEGKGILIGRHEHMAPDRFKMGFEFIRCHDGQWYPWLRCASFICPPLAKYIDITGRPVCSELAVKFLCGAELTPFDHWKGVNPNYLADAIRRWRYFDVIFEGKFSIDLIKQIGENKWIRQK